MLKTKDPKSVCLVIGNGAIGTAISSRLTMLGFEISFMGRVGPVNVKSRFEGWGQTNYLQIQSLSHADLSKVKIVFVALKAYDLMGAMNRYLTYIPSGIPVITLCNGAIEDLVAELSVNYNQYMWRIGICTFGVSQLSNEIYALKSKGGQALWGGVPSQKRSHNQLQDIEIEIFEKDKNEFFMWDDGIIVNVRKKWLFNVVINSLCAAKEFPNNGELLKDMKTLSLVYEEAFRLGKELWDSWNFNYDNLYVDLVSLISATSQNENSMARDVRMGRKTENAFLAQLSEGRRGYKLLPILSKTISKKKITRR